MWKMAKSWLENYENDKEDNNHKKKDTEKATSSSQGPQITTRRGKKGTNIVTCQVCEAQFDLKKEPSLMSCVSCDPKTYFCIDCIDMSDEEYQFMQRPDCWWSCPTHVAALTGEKNPMTMMSEMNEKITTINEQLLEVNKVETYLSQKMKEFDDKFSEKLRNHTKELSTEVPKVVKNSWAQIADTNNAPTDFRKVVKEALDTQKKEEAEKDQRDMNLIIYRAEESTEEDGEKRKEHDNKFFKDLCVEALGIGEIATKDVRRLGKPEKDKKRPLRITFEHKSQKELVMKNAKELSEAETKFKETSISYDYSKEERAKIKEKVEEAKEMGKNDLNYVYKVRGPPWDLKIKKFEKRQ